LGAGASTPFLKTEKESLTTQYLTDELLRSQNWRQVITILNNYKNKRNNSSTFLDNIALEDIFFLLNRIKATLIKRRFNFETLVYFLDKVCDFLSAQHESEYGNIDDYFFDFWIKIEKQYLHKLFDNSDPDGWNYTPFLAREVIINAILQMWKNSLYKKEGITLYKAFLTTLCNSFSSVNIYSLNYDPLLYESIKENNFSTGFEKDNKFNPVLFFKSLNTIAFLHGHVGFGFENGSIILNDNYDKIKENRIKHIVENGCIEIGMKGTHYDSYFITGLDKINGFSNLPFSAYLHKLGKDIIESDCIIMAGISLNDYHVNIFLSNALAVSNKEIVFVTKDDVKHIINSFKKGTDSTTIRLWTLTRDYATNLGEVSFGDYLEKINDSFQRNGFAKITNNIKIYIKGFEEFIKESNKLIS